MDIDSVDTGLTRLGRDERLWVEANLAGRKSAFEFMAVAGKFLQHSGAPAGRLAALPGRIESLKSSLAAVDEGLFQRVRSQIQSGAWTPAELREDFNLFTRHQPGQAYYGPDDLDLLLDGVLELGDRPPSALADPEMLHYEPAPARAILEFVDEAGRGPEDVFYDVGAGLGRTAILAHLVSGAPARGVEYDAELWELARAGAARLGLRQVEFVQGDAREADYAGGTVFFLFTPFRGEIFRAVMARLRGRASEGPIRIGTFGPCSAWTAAQPWLRRSGTHTLNDFTIEVFETAL